MSPLDRARRLAAWAALVATLLASPGAAGTCACVPRADSAGAVCVHCGPSAAGADASARLQRPSCCGVRVLHSIPAIVAAPVGVDREASTTPIAVLAPAADPGCGTPPTAAGRAPPEDFAANAPPSLYLVRFLRL